MTVFIGILVFMLGMVVCVQLLAACFSIVDLWYTIGSAYPAVIGKIVIWSAVAAGIAWSLGSRWKGIYLWGIVGYIGVYGLSFITQRAFLNRNIRLLEKNRDGDASG